MGTWQIVGKAWKVTLRGFGVVGLVVAVQLVFGLVSLPFVDDINRGTAVGLGVGLLLAIVSFFLWPVIQGGCLSFANATTLPAPAASPLASYRQGAGR
jgi:hypothetical protein